MKPHFLITVLCLLVAGCSGKRVSETGDRVTPSKVPAKAELIAQASFGGQHEAQILRYLPEENIAIVITPGHRPERKPYLHEGGSWIALWSPYLPEN